VDALKVTQGFEIAHYSREGMIWDQQALEEGSRPTRYARSCPLGTLALPGGSAHQPPEAPAVSFFPCRRKRLHHGAHRGPREKDLCLREQGLQGYGSFFLTQALCLHLFAVTAVPSAVKSLLGWSQGHTNRPAPLSKQGYAPPRSSR
jgi:hypothetical protein